jgi:Cu/Ag efflux protein CusF
MAGPQAGRRLMKHPSDFNTGDRQMQKLFIGVLAVIAATSAVQAGDMPHMMSGQHGHKDSAEHAAGEAQHAAPQTEGEVRKVDAAAGKLTVRHGPITNLGMSAMTMAFRVKDPEFLSLVREGDRIRMTVERIDGTLTIVALERVD